MSAVSSKSPSASGPTPAGQFAEIEALLARGKVRRALDLAKDAHKARPCPESETLVVRAYRARIEELLRAGLTREAQALVDLVNERYPKSQGLCADVQERAAYRSGAALDGLARLAAADASAEERERLECFVRCHVADPRQVADFAGLPALHPLRLEAAAVVEALAAVTSRPVTDAEIALPQVSRQSPFASWKLFVRALARFYARQDDECRRCLTALAPDSVPARLAPLLLALIEGRPPTGAGATLGLAVAVAGDTPRLRQALADLDSAFRSGRQKAVLQAIGEAVRECERSRPDVLQRLRQHVSACALIADIPAARVLRALGANSVKNAYFWRLFARACERQQETGSSGRMGSFVACAAWEEFRRHALHEGWFPADGPEEAAVYLHMLDGLTAMPPSDLEAEREFFIPGFVRQGGMAEYYRAEACQPASVMDCAPPSPPPIYFLYPEELYARACRAMPTAELFGRWLNWARNNDLDPGAVDSAASAWHMAIPADPRPLLVLAENAEARDALGKALKYLKTAEGLDGLNPEVRRARARLVVATALRHLRHRQRHLVAKDLADLAALPQMAEGDRPMLIAVLRWLSTVPDAAATERGASQAGTDAADQGIESLVAAAGDELTTLCLAYVLAGSAKAQTVPRLLLPRVTRPKLESEAFLRALARTQALCEEMHVPLALPLTWTEALPAAVRCGDAGLTEAQLQGLARFALGARIAGRAAPAMPPLMSTVYHLTGYGLRRAGADPARFLFLRGLSLVALDARDPRRGLACLRAARALAARHRDMVLVEEATDAERRYRGLDSDSRAAWRSDEDHRSLMSDEDVQRVLATERAALEFPPLRALEPRPARRQPTPRRRRQGTPDLHQGFLPGLDIEPPAEPDEEEPPFEVGDEPDDALDDEEEFESWLEDVFDDDGTDDDDGKTSPDGLPKDLPPGMFELVAELVSKHGKKGMDMLEEPETMARLEPRIFNDILKIFEDILHGTHGGTSPHSHGGGKKRKKRK